MTPSLCFLRKRLRSPINLLLATFLLVAGCGGDGGTINLTPEKVDTGDTNTAPQNANNNGTTDGTEPDTTDATDTDGDTGNEDTGNEDTGPEDTGTEIDTDNNTDNGDTEGTTDDTDDSDSGLDETGINETDNADTGDNTNSNVTNTNNNSDNSPPPPSTNGLRAFHRSGQTFLTWNEVDNTVGYHLYRSTQPITTENLSTATLLTSRWGPIDSDSSLHKHRSIGVPEFFIIEDGADQLDADTGLFVYTTQPGQGGSAYYAVTTVTDGRENKQIAIGENSLTAAVTESVDTPEPILTFQYSEGTGRIYTHFMDYTNWNPTLNGYAFSYMATLPRNPDPTRAYPLQVYLHEFGGQPFPQASSENDWDVIQILPLDPGLDQDTVHTWWYGHSADHNYQTDDTVPDGGSIENFTQQRVMRAISEIIAHPDFNVDLELIHASGNSMGASGALSLGMHYPSVFSGIYASQPMTNYSSSPLFQDNLTLLWGEQSDNLPNVIAGPYAAPLAKYSKDGSSPVAIWDWMNHHQQLRDRRADDFSYLIIDIGKDDFTIDYQTQGLPLVQALTDGRIPFAAALVDGISHSWRGYNAVNVDQFGLSEDRINPWHHRRSPGTIAIQYASDSGSLVPSASGDDLYNLNIEWSTDAHPFHQPVAETTSTFEVSLRSTSIDQTASITPRNSTVFRPDSGQFCSWTVSRNSNGETISSGSLIVDSSGLATANDVPVVTGSGSRLAIDCQ